MEYSTQDESSPERRIKNNQYTHFIKQGVADQPYMHEGCCCSSCSFRYTRKSGVAAERRASDVAAERRRKVWTRENNIQVLHCYFKSNPAQRGYRKRMLQIWNDNNNFNTTSQRLADQARMILNKKFFSDLEIIEISGQENQGIQIYQETTKQNDQHAGNQNLVQPTLTTQELTPEQRMDIELIQQIMADEKSTLPSLRNIVEKSQERN